jgi:hypothetical protein
VVGFGIVSLFGDATYEGARSILGPYLAGLGASAALVGLLTGGAEAVTYVLRLASGPAADSVRLRWPLAGWGYVVNVAAVPFLALSRSLPVAAVLVVGERAAKATRAPSRDTMLAEAGSVIGHSRAFSIHEAMDQTGALLGPLTVSLILGLGLAYRTAFAWLAIPAAGAIVTVAYLWRAVPHPEHYGEQAPSDPSTQSSTAPSAIPRAFWLYVAFSSLTMVGFATWGVLSFHLARHHVVASWQVPVLYAVAMGAGAVTPLAAGAAYRRFGLRTLVVLPFLAAVVPWLSFSLSPLFVWVGAVVWGCAQGVQESTMRTAVAEIVPAFRRGRGYGVFGSAYGLAWMAGGALTGALYGVSVHAVELFVLSIEIVALAVFVGTARQLAEGSR